MNTSKKLRFTLNAETGTLSEEDARRYFSRLGLATAALIVVNVAVQLLLAIPLARFAPSFATDPIVQNLLGAIPLYCVAFPVFTKLLSALPSVTPLSGKLSAKEAFGGLCVSFTAMTIGNYLSQMVVLWFGTLMGQSPSNPVEVSTVGTAWWINLIFLGLLAPIVEEILFRKILCRHLLPLGEGYAILLSAAIFGLAHGNFFQLFYAFGMGLIFGLIYVKTGKLIYSTVYHIVINVIGGVFAPWLIEQLKLEEMLLVLEELSASTAPDVSLLEPYLLPLGLLLLYDFVIYGAAIIGAVLLLRARKRYSLDAGLLPPPKKGRVGNIFLNVGVAAALTVFAGLFLLSLL